MKRFWIYLSISLLATPIILLLAVLLFTSLYGEPTPDAWENEPPGGTFANAHDLLPSDYFPVQETLHDEAVARLETESAILLSDEEAQHFVGEGWVATPDKAAYLVRALTKCCLASTHLYFNGEQLLVETGAMGLPSYTRTAFVVQLETAPQAVYVSIFFVE